MPDPADAQQCHAVLVSTSCNFSLTFLQAVSQHLLQHAGHPGYPPALLLSRPDLGNQSAAPDRAPFNAAANLSQQSSECGPQIVPVSAESAAVAHTAQQNTTFTHAAAAPATTAEAESAAAAAMAAASGSTVSEGSLSRGVDSNQNVGQGPDVAEGSADGNGAVAWMPRLDFPVHSITEMACMQLVPDFLDDVSQVDLTHFHAHAACSITIESVPLLASGASLSCQQSCYTSHSCLAAQVAALVYIRRKLQA